MDRNPIMNDARALWLQYYGLKIRPDGKFFQMENAAYLAGAKPQAERLPESPGPMVAT